MEFKGRIAKVLPMRSGTSQRGNEWKALPFVFEYFENETDRYADSVLVETFDTNIIDGLLSMCTKNPDGTPVVKDGAYDLIREIHCICGFGHKIRTFTNQNGETKTMNEIRLYKLESIKDEKRRTEARTARKYPAAYNYTADCIRRPTNATIPAIWKPH